jgi:hypothetical protein
LNSVISPASLNEINALQLPLADRGARFQRGIVGAADQVR